MPTVKIEDDVFEMLKDFCGEKTKMKYVASRGIKEYLFKQKGQKFFTKGGDITDE